MTVRMTSVFAAVLFLVASPAFAQTEAATLKDGWYTVENAPAVAPKPACPTKKPNKKDEFRPMYRAQGGQYVECAWDNQGRKKVAPYYWGAGQCLMQTLVPYQICLAGGLNYTTSPTIYFAGLYVPNGNYYGGQPYMCRGTGDPACYQMPPPASGYYPQPRGYTAPPPIQPQTGNQVYRCSDNRAADCYQ